MFTSFLSFILFDFLWLSSFLWAKLAGSRVKSQLDSYTSNTLPVRQHNIKVFLGACCLELKIAFLFSARWDTIKLTPFCFIYIEESTLSKRTLSNGSFRLICFALITFSENDWLSGYRHYPISLGEMLDKCACWDYGSLRIGITSHVIS